MRKLLAAAAFAAALPLAAEAAQDSVVIGMRGEPPGLDPTTGAAAAISEVALYNIYETLTRLDNNGAVLPMLAKSWTVSPDGLVYTFKLVEGVKFHDGQAFDSSDVKFSFERNKEPQSRNKRKEVFAAMKAIETPDPATVVIRLDKPKSLLTFELAQSTAVIVDPASAETNETKPIGTGPYRFAKWVKGDSVTLEKFAGHRDAAQLKIAKATFRFIPDAAAQVTALLAGDVDYVPILGAPELFQQFKDNPAFQTLQGTTEGEVILATNNKRPGLSDVRMRRAIAHAIDRKSVIEAAMFGYGQPIGSHFPPHHPAYVDLTGMYPYDQAKARALLKEAGYDGHELQLRLPPFDYAMRAGEIVADMLQQVGIKVKLENLEWARWLEEVYKRHQYDLSIVSHVEPMDMAIYAKDDYYFEYDSPEFKEIMAKADAAVTQAEQYKWLQAAQRKLAEDAVNGFLFELPKLGVAKKGLKGLWTNSPAFIHRVAEMRWE
jgi:peptide/nickel transport system substrate-binding protein